MALDGPRFQQGITTSSIPIIYERGGFYSAFLNTKGRVLHEVFVYPNNLACSIFIAATITENSLTRLPSDPSITSVFTSAASTFSAPGANASTSSTSPGCPISASASLVVLLSPSPAPLACAYTCHTIALSVMLPTVAKPPLLALPGVA